MTTTRTMTYTVDQDAVETYMGDFADECDIPASAERLAARIQANMDRYFPEFRVTVGWETGPVARPLELDSDDDDNDAWRQAIEAMIDDLWQDGNLWVVDRQ